jgi:glycosyltransferase involved in cell wall biosynthesis
MKILIMNQHFSDYIGGSELQCDLIAKYSKKHGHEVIYGAINSKGNTYLSDYKVVPIKKISFWSLRKLFKEIKPDLVYWRYNKNFLLAAGILCNYNDIKLVFSISTFTDIKKWVLVKLPDLKRQGVYRRLRSIARLIKVLLLNRINYTGYRFVDGIVSLREDLLQEIPSFKNKLQKICIYNSMEIKISGKFQWEKPYVIWVANIKERKNPALYIKAAEKFIDKKVDFLMVGKIQDDSYSFIRNKDKLPSNFFYLGEKQLEEVNSMIKNSLFLISTCNPEGFSNNFIQAWMLEKPTVTLFFDPDGLIEKYNIGYFSGTFENMCTDINTLIDDDTLRLKMGSQAKIIATDLFNPEKNLKRYISFFEDVFKN